ncbi:MAG: hypothetical protein J7K98_02505 [Candidatus Aenigmarchaeota archaeon]|nr:hypothetical protein [Candidatus Aenigmarchaeota archaeon]
MLVRETENLSSSFKKIKEFYESLNVENLRKVSIELGEKLYRIPFVECVFGVGFPFYASKKVPEYIIQRIGRYESTVRNLVKAYPDVDFIVILDDAIVSSEQFPRKIDELLTDQSYVTWMHETFSSPHLKTFREIVRSYNFELMGDLLNNPEELKKVEKIGVDILPIPYHTFIRTLDSLDKKNWNTSLLGIDSVFSLTPIGGCEKCYYHVRKFLERVKELGYGRIVSMLPEEPYRKLLEDEEVFLNLRRRLGFLPEETVSQRRESIDATPITTDVALVSY